MKTAPKLTRKQQRENADRRNRALTVLVQYGETVGNPHDDTPTNLGDLLADLLHLAGEMVFDECLCTARAHYEAERTGQE
jgi:hypothetical protein